MSDDRSRWNELYSRRAEVGEPSPFLVESSELLPTTGSAVDIAGGTGRNALWLAERGLDVTLVDVAEVALDAAEREAGRRELELSTVRRDVESDGLPAGRWDLAVITLFLHWPVMEQAVARLAPGGTFAFMQPTMVNLEKHLRPGQGFLVEPGQVGAWVDGTGLEVLHLSEGWRENTGRHEARLIARRSG